MTIGKPASAGAPGRFAGGWPGDVQKSMRLLDAGTGNRGLTQAMLRDSRWPGADLASADFDGGGAAHLVLVQATTMPMSGAMGRGLPGPLPAFRFPPIGGVQGERLGSGALRIGGTVLTAAALLQEMDQARERAAVQDAIAGFRLDPNRRPTCSPRVPTSGRSGWRRSPTGNCRLTDR